MKKIIFSLSGLFLLAAAFTSCTDQDETYKQYVKADGYIYPQVASNLTATEGYKRLQISWDTPKDPSIRTGKIYWENRTQSADIDYSQYTGSSVVFEVDGLEERSYTFEVVNYDKNGNTSMAKEVTASPYAESWLTLHSSRSISSANMDDKGETANVVMTESTDEMVLTQVRYVNSAGDSVVVDVDNDLTSISLPDAKPGTRFSFRSSFTPYAGLDTVWSEWKKSPTPIVGLLDNTGFVPVATTGQVRGDSYLEKFIFDGINTGEEGTYWQSSEESSNRKTFPKIMAIDLGKDTYFLTKIVLQQDPRGTTTSYHNNRDIEIYFGDEPFDPDAGSNYKTSSGFVNAEENGKKLTSTILQSAYNYTSTWTSSPINYRYMAIVWKNSRNTNGYISLSELEIYGYDDAAE